MVFKGPWIVIDSKSLIHVYLAFPALLLAFRTMTIAV